MVTFIPMFLDSPQALALTVTTTIIAAISAVMWHRGPAALGVTLTFVASLITTQLLMSSIGGPRFGYKFPSFLTALHFLMVWFACIAYWSYYGELKKCLPNSIGFRRFTMTIIPIALSNPLSVLFNNKALVFAGAGACAIVGMLSPVMVAVVARAFGRLQSTLAWLGVFIAFSGALVVGRSEIKSVQNMGETTVLIGMGFALCSVLARCAKIVVMDLLLAPDEYCREPLVKPDPLHPMHLYALQAPWSFLTAVVVAFLTEDPRAAVTDLQASTLIMIGLSVVSAIVLNFAGIFALRYLGASLQQLVGKLNTICITALSMGFLGETLPTSVLLGGGIILVGVMVFERGSVVGKDSSVLSATKDKV